MKLLWAVVVATSAFVLFVLIEFLRLACHGRISYSLDFGSVLDAVVLLVVFVLIDYAYSKQSSQKRADTELLLAIISEARSALHEVEEKSEYCDEFKSLNRKEQLAVTRSQRDLSNAIHSIEEALRHCGMDCVALQFERIKGARDEVNEAVTDTPYPGPYDFASLRRIRKSMTAMRDELTRILFAVNRR